MNRFVLSVAVTAMGLALASGAQARAESVYDVHYKCPDWKTRTFTNGKVAQVLLGELQALGFEARLEKAPKLYKVQYRLMTERTKTFTSEEISHALRDWLVALGCAVKHHHH